jgi:tRNA pseudouridine38-40 synthase
LRYFFHISYNGINYHGWQRQNSAISVREVFETNLAQVLKEPVECIGCGRTDTMVHANQFFFHIDIQKEWDFDLLFRINKMIPRDISVFDIIKVEDNQHARYDAISRTYDYFIHTYKDPFLNERSSLYLEKDFDLDKMNQAVKLISTYSNFYSFCLTPQKQFSTNCQISSAKLFSNHSADRLRFQITSNRFLRGMIRIIVAKLIEIGTGKLSVEEFENLLINKIALDNTKPAYPQGLYLSKIIYPYLNLPPRTDLTSSTVNDWVEI